MQFRATVFQILLLNSFVIPGLVAIVTKRLSAGWVKQVTLIVLSAAGGFVAVMVADTDYSLWPTLTLIGSQIILATAAYFGLDKIIYLPLAGKTENFGVGKAKPQSPLDSDY